uniref:Large ribosomal subunit protein mL64 n=1 Tax=Setaria digitata TaxID=48799 RepID=A0A915Q4H8_9BILA
MTGTATDKPMDTRKDTPGHPPGEGFTSSTEELSSLHECDRTIMALCGRRAVMRAGLYPFFLGTRAQYISGVTDGSSGLEERNRNTKVVSRLTERHRLIAEGRLPPVSYEWEKELWAKRQRFGTYGVVSGVKPEELWPSVEIGNYFQEIQEEEAIGWYAKYIDVLKSVQNTKKLEHEATLARLKEMVEVEERHPEMLKEFLKNQKEVVPMKSKQELATEQQAKDMLEYYGYEISSNDPRFPILFERMTEAKKKAAKLAEKEELTLRKRASRKKEKEKKQEKKEDS